MIPRTGAGSMRVGGREDPCPDYRMLEGNKVPTDGEPDEHREGACDHRYFPWELYRRWLFWSPAGRLEKVTDVDPGEGMAEYAVRVWTEDTGPVYAWRIPRHHRLHAIPPSDDRDPHLRIVELGGPGLGATITVVPAYGWQEIPEFRLALAIARNLGPGKGLAADRPPGRRRPGRHPPQQQGHSPHRGHGRRPGARRSPPAAHPEGELGCPVNSRSWRSAD